MSIRAIDFRNNAQTSNVVVNVADYNKLIFSVEATNRYFVLPTNRKALEIN